MSAPAMADWRTLKAVEVCEIGTAAEKKVLEPSEMTSVAWLTVSEGDNAALRETVDGREEKDDDAHARITATMTTPAMIAV